MKSDKRKQQYKQLGLAVAYYRKMHGLTQLQLAEECDLSRTHISNLEAPNMPTSISLEALFDIADVLEVPIKCFFDFPDGLRQINIGFQSPVLHRGFLLVFP